MKRWLITVVILAVSVATVDSQSGLAALLKAGEKVTQGTNVALGTFSRSKIVSAISMSLRGEEDAKVRESLNQAIVTLSVLDIGGGALLPFTDHLVDTITKQTSFEATMRAWGQYNLKLKEQLAGSWDSLDDDAIKSILRQEKQKVLAAFDGDVAKLSKSSKTLKHINRAKRWFRVKTVGKVLGPLFDTVGVGVNSWALHTAIRDCNDDPNNCNYGSIAAATLSIASGLVGLGTFIASLVVSSTVLGPVGAIVSFVLAIGATLIELFYTPPVDQAAIDYQRKLSYVKQLDKYSRLLLYNANRAMIDNKIEKGDLYVVNQGHLPKWFSPNAKVTFGYDASKNPRKIVTHRGLCYRPSTDSERYSGWNTAGTFHDCPLLVDGKDIQGDRGENIGYSFYGFTKRAKSIQKGKVHVPTEPYRGSVILVNTEKVQSALLRKENFDDKLRGIAIDTGRKGNSQPFEDLVSIANMKNLDAGETVDIKTGTGNDALNIDGMIGERENALNANLGPGHNTLSFQGMPDNSEIKGIEYNPSDGIIHYFLGSGRRKHNVGTIAGVEILGASPLEDVIKLYASKKGLNGDDFTVFKFDGKATYLLDVGQVAPLTKGPDRNRYGFTDRVPHFKIIDSTDNGGTGDVSCNNHVPLLKVINFGSGAVANDILYDGKRIKIYANDPAKRKRSVNESDSETTSKKQQFNNPYGRYRPRPPTPPPKPTIPPSRCSGEPGDNSHPKGGTNGKRLIATVSLHTKCPAEVEALNADGSCMMSNHKIPELDLVFFGGDRFMADFTQNVASRDVQTPVSDVCTLKCPDQQITNPVEIKLGRGSNDYLVIRNDLFLDKCNIDGEDARLMLRNVDENTWALAFEGEHEKFKNQGKRHEIKGVEWIINEYGEKITGNLRDMDETEIDLFDKYTKKTVVHLADEASRERSKEIGDEMKKCLADQPSELDATVCRLS